MNSLAFRLVFGLLVISTATTSVHAQIIEMQNFDTPISASTAGWTGFRNGLDSNAFGFSATNYTGGLSPAGEAGGTIARTSNLAYYSDLTLGGAPNLGYSFQSSGELVVRSISNFNNAVRIGFFDASNTVGPFSFVGFQVAEAQSPTGLLRVLATVHLADGTIIEAGNPVRIAIGDTYSWTSNWDPLLKTMTVEVFNSAGGSLGTSTTNPDGSETPTAILPNAFGMVTGGIGLADPTNVADVFVDNLTYSFTVVPEPSSIALMVVALSGIVGLRRQFKRTNSRSI